MRQGHNNKRMRGRNRKGPNPMSRSFESNGPDVKIRGTALHVAEKYVTLARDAASSGDRVAEQNYLQHAEHYYRIVAAAQAQMPQPQPQQRSDDDIDDDDRAEADNEASSSDQNQRHEQPYGLSQPQPYLNGNGHDANGGGQNGSGEERSGERRSRGRRARPQQAAPDNQPAASEEPAPVED